MDEQKRKLLNQLIDETGRYYGSDSSLIYRMKMRFSESDILADAAIVRLREIKDRISSIKESGEKRVFCRDCANLGQDLQCACARNGKLGDGLNRYRPAPYVPRTCAEFFPSMYDISIPPPPAKIKIIEQQQDIFTLGYHPHDKKWIHQMISESVADEKKAEALEIQYREKFREFMTSEECPKNGKEGYARQRSNNWLRGELKKLFEPEINESDNEMPVF